MERARDGEAGFAERVEAVIVDGHGVPDRFITYEFGAGWIGGQEDHAEGN